MREFFNKFGNSCTLVILGIFAVSLVIGYSGNQGGRGGRNSGSNGPNPAEAVIATVNGQNLTEADFREVNARMMQQAGSAPAGPNFAALQGQSMQTLIQRTVIEQEAKRRKARPLEADIDRTIDQYRQSVATQQGKAKLTDQEWASYLDTNRGMSVSDLREQAAKSLTPLALVNSLKGEEKVTENEARNQTAQAHLSMISVPYQEPGSPPLKGKALPLTEAEAQQKANALYAKIKAGADFATVARSNADNPDEAKKGGDQAPIAEYPPAGANGAMSLSLPLLYGKDLAEAVHKLAPGQTTDVVKFSGLEHAYGIARLVDRKLDTPKDFDPKKAIAALTTQRAEEKAEALIKSLVKSAKIEFKDPDKKTYYDLAKLESAGQEATQAMMSGQVATPPTKAETDAQQAVIDKGFEDMLKRHPDDITAAIMVADSIKRRKLEDPASLDRRIALDEIIAKSNDDFDRHFELADLYGQKKQVDKAKVHLDRVAKLLGYNTPYDLEGFRSADATHRTLEKKYRSLGLTADADREKAASDALQPKIAAESMKQLEEQRKARAAQGAQGAQGMPQFNIPAGGGQTIPPVNVPAGGGSQAITITPDATGGAATPAPNTGIKITPSSGGGAAASPSTPSPASAGGGSAAPASKGR